MVETLSGKIAFSYLKAGIWLGFLVSSKKLKYKNTRLQNKERKYGVGR